MSNLKKVYEILLFGEQAIKKLKTLANVESARECFMKIQQLGCAETISEEVAMFYKKHKFVVSKKEIGWLIMEV